MAGRQPRHRAVPDPGPLPGQEPGARGEDLLNLLPVPVWIEDYSGVKRRVEQLRSGGADDLEEYLDRRPQEVLALAGMVRTVWLNEAALKFHEAEDRATFIGHLHRISGKSSFEAFKKEVVALTEGRPEFVREAVAHISPKDAKHLLLHVKVDPACARDLSRVYVAVTDITSIKEAEEDLKSSEARYRQAFEMAPIPMVMMDSRTEIIVDANRPALELLGYAAESFVGATLGHSFPEESAEQCADVLSRARRGEQSFIEDLHLRNKDGRDTHVAVTARNLRARGCSWTLLGFSLAGAATPAWDRRGRDDRRAASTLRRKLSERERQVLALIASGHTNQAIADRLCISRKTVETHRQRLMQKLDIHKATELVRYALTAGFAVKV